MLRVTKSLLMFYRALATSRIPFEYKTSNFFIVKVASDKKQKNNLTSNQLTDLPTTHLAY